MLGGPASILGQWPQLDVVVLTLRAPGSADEPNTHKLQPPLHDTGSVLKGRLVCVRMDEDSEPVDFTKAEFAEFAARTIDPASFSIPDGTPKRPVQRATSPMQNDALTLLLRCSCG